MFRDLSSPAPLERYQENLSGDLGRVKLVLGSGDAGGGTGVRNKLNSRDRIVKHLDYCAIGGG